MRAGCDASLWIERRASLRHGLSLVDDVLDAGLHLGAARAAELWALRFARSDVRFELGSMGVPDAVLEPRRVHARAVAALRHG